MSSMCSRRPVPGTLVLRIESVAKLRAWHRAFANRLVSDQTPFGYQTPAYRARSISTKVSLKATPPPQSVRVSLVRLLATLPSGC